ncbi:hypothetical protein ROZALSC1DRAFT_26160, partial [Rozella allomycis CSF55]
DILKGSEYPWNIWEFNTKVRNSRRMLMKNSGLMKSILVHEGETPHSMQEINISTSRKIWEGIWASGTNSYYSQLLWKIYHGVYLTNKRFARFSDVSAMCSKCQVKEETVFHRFFDCESFSKRIWSSFFPETPNSRALYLFLLDTEDFMNLRGKRILYYIHEAFKRNLSQNQVIALINSENLFNQ